MAPRKPALRHFLQFRDLSRAELTHLFARTRWIKDRFKRYKRYWPLQDRTQVMIFEKQSTRTRLAFEAGMRQLGGSAIFVNTRDSQLGRGEPVEDAAQVISRMCDLVMIRTFVQDIVSKGESYGYELIQEVKRLSGDQIKWTDGMLYPVLHRMEDNGWIKSRWVEIENGRKRKYYSIRKGGHQALKEKREQWTVISSVFGGLWKGERV